VEDVVCKGQPMRVNLLKDHFVRGCIINTPFIHIFYGMKVRNEKMVLIPQLRLKINSNSYNEEQLNSWFNLGPKVIFCF